MDDQELEERVREALYQGAVDSARQLAQSIDDPRLRRAMLQLVREYES